MILGLTAAQLLIGAAVLALAILPWGTLLTRGLTPGLLWRGERVALAALVGYPVACALFYLLCRAGWPALFLPASALAGLAALALGCRGGETSPRADPDARARPHWSLALFVPLALFTMMRWNRAFSPVEGGLAYDHSVDHSLHMSFYWELLRGVPPKEVPVAGGIPFPAYHFLAFMPGLLLLQSTELAMTSVSHVLSPLLKLLLLVPAVYLTVRVRTGDGRTATAVLPALFCAAYAFESAFNERFVVGPSPHYDLVRNEAAGGGLVVWASIACLLVLHDRARRQEDPGADRLLLLASLLAGLSYAFKAQLFLLFGGAYALVLVVDFLRGRSREPLKNLLVMASAFAALLWLSRGAGSFATVEWRPGLFAELYIYPNLRRDPSALSQALRSVFESFPAGFGYLLAVTFAMMRIVAFSPLVPAFLLSAARRAKTLELADRVAALAFVLALPMGYGLSIVSFYKATSPFEFRQAAHGLAFLGVLIDVVALRALLGRRGRDAGAWVLGAATLAAAAAAPTLVQERHFVPARSGIVLSPDEQCALLFLREQTPIDALVVSARTGLQRLNHQAVVSGFAGRRAVLEVFEKEVDWDNDRERDIRRLFSTEDAQLAQRILERYRVDYVLESPALPLQARPELLRLVHQRGGHRVFRIERSPDAPPAPPPAKEFRRPDELRCLPSGQT